MSVRTEPLIAGKWCLVQPIQSLEERDVCPYGDFPFIMIVRPELESCHWLATMRWTDLPPGGRG